LHGEVSFDRDLGDKAKSLFGLLALHAGENGYRNPSQRCLARELHTNQNVYTQSPVESRLVIVNQLEQRLLVE
jgi:hypothetical protein